VSDDDEDINERSSVDAKAMRDALAKTAAPIPRDKAPTYARPEPKPCASCGTVVPILVSAPGFHRRTVCALCQGKANRDALNALADAVRTLKESADPAECRRAIDVINRLDNQPKETIEYVRATRLAAPTSPKSRKGFL